MDKSDMNEKRITRLEDDMQDLHKTMKVDMKELKADMKQSIKEGFDTCRIVMPLRCEKNRKAVGTGTVIAVSSVICSTIIGVILFLAKSGMLDAVLTK